jgi:bifunctional oligoribonuclease and PAP phosphatase NrnA
MNLADFVPLFTRYNSYLLTTHLNPDGDGLGSQLALRAYLAAQGKNVRCINHSPTPQQYRFLDPDGSRIEVYDTPRHRADVDAAECIIILDTNSSARIGNMEAPVIGSVAAKVVIDHHLETDRFADHYIVDENAAATGEIVYKLLDHLTDGHLDKTMAVGLYTAVMTDTGSFRFPKTDRETHRITAELLQYGVDPADIYREIYERGPVNRLILLGKALEGLSLHHEGRVAVMRITHGMFHETGTDTDDTDGFVNYALQVDTVKIALFFTEYNGLVKISFRARGDIWINELAKVFGGGGHQHAAGATIPNGDLSALIAHAVERAPLHLS